MRVVKTATALVLVGVATMTFAVGTLISLLANTIILMNRDVWYFPGDPPYPEIGLDGSAIAAASVAVFVVGQVINGWRRNRAAKQITVAAIGLLVLGTLLPTLVIVRRHLGEWRALRSMVWSEVMNARSTGVASKDFADGPTLRFAGRPTPVRIRAVSSGEWPTVLIDFGEGGNALFDLRTMWCVYSD